MLELFISVSAYFISIFFDFPDHFYDFIWGKQKDFPKLKRNQARTLMMVCFSLLWVQWNYFLSVIAYRGQHFRNTLFGSLCQGWVSISDALQKQVIQTSFYSIVKKSLLNWRQKDYCYFIANFFPVGYKPEEPNNAQQTMYYTLWEMKDKEKQGAEEVRDFCCLSFMVDKFLSLIISNDFNVSLPHIAKANSNFKSHSRDSDNIISASGGEEPRNLTEWYVHY